MNVPKLGRPVRGSSSGRPIMVVLDVLGRRGALRVLWELRDGPLTFRALQEACETNPGSLNARLKDLRELGTVVHDDGGYRLTDSGHSLMKTLNSLQSWSERWASGAQSQS
ncbi:winged helix-turn-helix transcriptional regulator [Mycolicibacterium pallens]|uniref:Helix-turn-helix transcriptional regulator n=1 Tax=Mycolicibacterium pallens TaxID=370524 RepID=A0ABX8VBK4_9MYCO|nr:helix-turn-helix domain-containing protein [Mycolicibacterium pallens]APE14368.1 transcriptional regulator [Mycobacterium sp. WY10]QYL15165.1 helix-turn-helix transcriptional regulator [Mycolicibacterium pallens]